MLIRFIFSISLFCFAIYEAHSINDFDTNPREAGFGDAGVAVFGFGGLYYNQAGIVDIDHVIGSISYQSHFLIRQLDYQNIGFVVPSKTGVFGISYSQLGYSMFRKHMVGIAYGIRITDKWTVGMKINHYGLFIGNGYGRKGVFVIEGGMNFSVNEKWKLAVHVYNQNHQKLNTQELFIDRVPTIMELGFRHQASDKVVLLGAITNNFSTDYQFKTGFEYHVSIPLYVRMGIKTNPGTHTLGIGYHFQSWMIDLAAFYQYNLGLTPQVSIQYHFK